MTVGLVVVSHSRPLADAAVALAGEMAHGDPLRVAVAAGVDGGFGTDALAISAAITDVDGPDGVVVLMDLGSAVLSAELALDLLDDEATRDRVTLCAAPIVEGLVVAAVAAAGGAPRAEVAAEAEGALSAKRSHLAVDVVDVAQRLGGPAVLGGADPAGATAAGAGASGPNAGGTGVGDATAGGTGVSATFTVAGAHGLHARPAARLVQVVRGFDAVVTLRNVTTGAGPEPATSLSRVATLAVLHGHEAEIHADGPDAGAAVDAVLTLAARDFDEAPTAVPGPESPSGAVVPAKGDAATPPTAPAAGSSTGRPTGPRFTPPRREPDEHGVIHAIAASPGIVIGVVRRLEVEAVVVPDEVADDPTVEHERLRVATTAVRTDIERVRDRAPAAEAGIFDAHLLLLDDPDLTGEARADIDRGVTAPRAWADAIDRAAGAIEAVDDPYLRERAADVRAVGDQVLRALLFPTAAADQRADQGADQAAGETASTAIGESGNGESGNGESGHGEQVGGEFENGVLVAVDLTPAEAAELDPARVRGIVLAAAGPTAHSAILARARGIPTVVAAGQAVLDVADGSAIAIDGGAGEVALDPDAATLAAFEARATARATRQAAAATRAHEPARTRDGVTIHVAANVGSVADARAAHEHGADLAGLVRTEFLFLGRDAAPDVDEQEAAYLAIAEAMGGERITLRTLDVGGDKPLRYVPMPHEANPFLGVRGIRLALARPELLRAQLTAIVRVARRTPVSVMFPMVSTVAELHAARAALDDAIARERPTRADLQVGIMVEVPAVAANAAAFAPHVDFLSIGTNDLTQYALAAERGNDAVAALADPLDPGVLRLVESVCDAAAATGTLVAVCGEVAADESAAPLLVALGVRELSVAPRSVPAIKAAVRDADARGDLASRALDRPGAQEVRALLR